MMKPDAVEAHERSASCYDDMSRQVENHAHEVMFGLAFEYTKPGETILDIGIGTGLSSFLFNKAGLKTYGIDGSKGMLDICKKKGFAEELAVYDLAGGDWPYNDGQFDHAICCGVFHFFQDPDIFFKETSRVLKSNGTFIFTVLEASGEKASYADEASGLCIYRHHEDQIDALARTNGFIPLKKVSFYAYKDPDKKDKALFKGYVIRKGKAI
jgi:ubiquinone/menaquinone biosynthesis C-methylase UbiE